MKGFLITISAICFSMAVLHLSQHFLPSRPDISGFLAGITYWPVWELILKLTTKKREQSNTLC